MAVCIGDSCSLGMLCWVCSKKRDSSCTLAFDPYMGERCAGQGDAWWSSSHNIFELGSSISEYNLSGH